MEAEAGLLAGLGTPLRTHGGAGPEELSLWKGPTLEQPLPKGLTSGKRPRLEQFMQNCSPREEIMLEKFMEGCVPCREPQAGSVDEYGVWSCSFPEEEGAEKHLKN